LRAHLASVERRESKESKSAGRSSMDTASALELITGDDADAVGSLTVTRACCAALADRMASSDLRT
jgi:hypothetical protein